MTASKVRASKQVLLRLPQELVDKIDERAGLTGRSRNNWCIAALNWVTDQPVRDTTTTVIRKERT